MAVRTLILGCLVFVAAASAGVAAPRAPSAQPVQVRIEKTNYPVRQAAPPAAYLKTNPNLAGKASYTTDAIVLENQYLKAVILPEFGARLPRVTFKRPNRDLFWVNDVLEDGPPWSMGGIGWSFPFYEHGRHLDEGAGWRIVHSPDGSVTVAMDMRFSQYAGEVQRYGRFSDLRQAILVTLRPGTSILEYTSRIDSRSPLRHGFRLWSVAHFPRQDGANVLWPAGAVTDRGASARQPWPTWDDTDHSRLGSWGTSSFGVDAQGGWAGVYYPDADANHLILKPRFTAPGTRLYAADLKEGGEPAHADKRIEIGNGSNPVFEHPGHFLPPFGAYLLPLRLTMVTGIGRIDWANDVLAVSYEPHEAGARIRIVSFEARPNCSAMARTKAETVKAEGTMGPDRPLVVELTKRSAEVLLTVVQAEDELAEVSLPWKPEPTPPETFQAIQREMRPWGPLAMELSDWPREQAPNLADAAKALVAEAASNRPDAILQAACVVLRTEAPGSPRWQAVRGLLSGPATGGPRNRHVAAFLGMMTVLEAGGRPSPEAAKHLANAEKLVGAQYLLALDAVAGGNATRALALLGKAADAVPSIAIGAGDDALVGNNRVHPAAVAGGEWPAMLRAVVAIGQNRIDTAAMILEQLLRADPARPEAVALLADVYRKKMSQPGKVVEAQADAERLFQRNEQARRDYEALLREAREGIWSGIPRP
jgi:tetratricopeptide (TPR) repeat protein